MRKFALLLTCLLLCGIHVVFAQSRTITGKVTESDDGTSLPGVSVVVKGTSIGTVTDIDGKFSLNVTSDAKILRFSFVGYSTKEVDITSTTTVKVVLEKAALNVDEVVVTAVGIQRDAKALGYGVQTVKNEDLTRVSNYDVVNSLSAKAAGVQITSSGGTAGASSYITIRGASSILGNNQPLFIVDGLPIISGGGGGGDWVDGVANPGRSVELNPEEIESMTILKGGAATALYGLQAANGAIIITTKKAKGTNKLEVNVSSSITMEQISQKPRFQTQFAQGIDGAWISGNAASWGPKMSESAYSKDPSVWTKSKYDVAGAIVPKDDPLADPALGAVTPFDPYAFFQQGITYNNNISVSSGNEKNKFLLSIGDYDQKGIIPNNTFKKLNFRMNASSKILDNLEVGANASFINTTGNFIQQGSNVSGVMLGLLRTPPSFDNAAGWKFADGKERTYRNGSGYDNPYWVANELFNQQDVNRFMGNAFINWEATKWFSVSYNVGTDFYIRRVQDYFPINSRANTSGLLSEIFYFNQVFNSDLLLNFKYDISEKINLRFTLGHNLYSDYYKALEGDANGLQIPGFVQISNTSAQTTSSATTNMRTMGVFGDLQIDLYDMLYIGFTGRNDWSTTMPEGNLSAFYPSASLGFVFTELSGLKDNDILSFGKLRASYAKTANIAQPYGTTTNFVQAGPIDGWTTGLSFPLMGYAGFTLSNTIGNANLKHETKTTTEVGAELRFFKNRLGIDVDYFKNVNENLLLFVPVAASSGSAQMYMNAGTMESYGVELSITATPVKTKDFDWTISGNFSKIKNPVTKLAPGVDNVFLGGFVEPQIRAVAGMEYRSIYGYQYYHDDAGNLVLNDDPTDGYPDGKPMTDDRSMVAIGNVNPDWLANVSSTITYKGIGFSFLLDIKKGGNMYNGSRFAMNYFGTSYETSFREVNYNPDGTINYATTPAENLVVYQGVLGHIDGTGNVVTTGVKNTLPVVNDQAWYRGQGSNFGGGATAGAIEDAGWIRLREVSLSYTFQKKLLNKTFIKDAQIYVSGKNLWLNTAYKGVDPETSLVGADNAQGLDYFNMPGSKSITFGVRIGL